LRQQILLLTTLLVGSVLIGWWTYRPAPPIESPTTQVTEAAPTAQPPASKPDKVTAPPKPAVSVKKERFFKRLLPLISYQNRVTLERRAELLRMKAQLEQDSALSRKQKKLLKQLLKRYRLHLAMDDASVHLHIIDKLLARIDMIPPSLALAQAATESAWGRSRFARKANNLYGQWCFTAGCGLIPLQRPEGMNHEVASYPSWQASVAAYFLNLNSHPAYQPLRDIRLQLREKNLTLSGSALAVGLEKYSARGTSYVKSLQRIIRVNDLARLD